MASALVGSPPLPTLLSPGPSEDTSGSHDRAQAGEGSWPGLTLELHNHQKAADVSKIESKATGSTKSVQPASGPGRGTMRPWGLASRMARPRSLPQLKSTGGLELIFSGQFSGLWGPSFIPSIRWTAIHQVPMHARSYPSDWGHKDEPAAPSDPRTWDLELQLSHTQEDSFLPT